MQLLPTIVVFIIVSLILVGVFSLISFVYFRIKRRKALNVLAETFSPDDNVDEPYIEMVPLQSSRVKDKDEYEMDLPTPKLATKGKINLSNMRNSKARSFSFSVPQINNNKTLGTTVEEDGQSQEKYSYVSKLVKYTKEGIQLYTSELVNIASSKVFKNLKWQTSFQGQPIIQRTFYPSNSPNFSDLLDIFKLQTGQFTSVKFIVQAVIKNCINDKTYYLQDLPKTQRVQTVSKQQYQRIKNDLQKS